jgi:hypothetical protein
MAAKPVPHGGLRLIWGSSTLFSMPRDFETATTRALRGDVIAFLKGILAESTPRRALIHLYDGMDQWMSAGLFEACDEALRVAPLERFSNELVVGFLAASLPARQYLRHRPALVCRARELFEKRNLNQPVITELLDGLE